MITIAQIQEQVSREFGISTYEMLSRRRGRKTVRARWAGIWLSRKFTRNSLPEIARSFSDIDHTTVMHACRRVPEVMEINPEFAEHINALIAHFHGILDNLVMGST